MAQTGAATSGTNGLWRYLQVGAKLSPLECLLAYCFPLVFLSLDSTLPELQALFFSNLISQLLLFVVVVQVPLFLTGNMIYVDIGWPSGLVLLATSALRGNGYWLRRYLVGGCFLLHGLRMALGAIYMFGVKSKFTYRFEQDLPRYQYAKVKWVKSGMPERWWWVKAQQDTIQQCFANSVVLACPLLLAAVNTTPEIHVLEWAGLAIWVGAWVFENIADTQMQLFLRNCRKEAQANPERKEEIKLAVLGHGEYNTSQYLLWTLCRHPNYFGEWMCWVGFVVVGASSLVQVSASSGCAGWRLCGFGVVLVYVTRFFYDCLNHWTGAGPAEHFSFLKRPQFGEYQRSVRCFFPFELPFVDHFREAGWPDNDNKKKA
eukprot:TRINITY_DN8812_c0_g1_i2.p1 TRINITY_DN8812_c0_g1~~TRINITY_DN8812_c0_g1_i2.p1  ORF type:complete len:374 (+),score=74.25 TRINITY_DN8812_c0_g1_i2:201-1322(+)